MLCNNEIPLYFPTGHESRMTEKRSVDIRFDDACSRSGKLLGSTNGTRELISLRLIQHGNATATVCVHWLHNYRPDRSGILRRKDPRDRNSNGVGKRSELLLVVDRFRRLKTVKPVKPALGIDPGTRQVLLIVAAGNDKSNLPRVDKLQRASHIRVVELQVLLYGSCKKVVGISASHKHLISFSDQIIVNGCCGIIGVE